MNFESFNIDNLGVGDEISVTTNGIRYHIEHVPKGYIYQVVKEEEEKPMSLSQIKAKINEWSLSDLENNSDKSKVYRYIKNHGGASMTDIVQIFHPKFQWNYGGFTTKQQKKVDDARKLVEELMKEKKVAYRFGRSMDSGNTKYALYYGASKEGRERTIRTFKLEPDSGDDEEEFKKPHSEDSDDEESSDSELEERAEKRRKESEKIKKNIAKEEAEKKEKEEADEKPIREYFKNHPRIRLDYREIKHRIGTEGIGAALLRLVDKGVLKHDDGFYTFNRYSR